MHARRRRIRESEPRRPCPAEGVVEREDVEEQEAENERGNRVEDEQHAGGDVVEGPVAPPRLIDAERQRDDDRTDERHEREPERPRDVELQDPEDAVVLPVAVTEVEVHDDAVDVVPEEHGVGVVQVERPCLEIEARLRDVRAAVDVRGSEHAELLEVLQCEREPDDKQDHEQPDSQSPDDVREHRGSIAKDASGG